jgi:polyisoprenoid-binding protein YceI
MKRSFDMRKCVVATVAVLALGVAALPGQAADNYQIDPMHTSAVFKIGHIGVSWIHGRFNDVAGEFVIDAANPSRSSFTMTIKTESIDTNNAKRDGHLKSPDFFNVKQFPLLAFKSTAVKPVKDGYDVTGDLTMHGVTKSITVPLRGGRTAEFPKGVQRTGFTAEAMLRRSDFGMDRLVGPVGEEVYFAVSFEGVKK